GIGDVLDVGQPDARRAEAVIDGVIRKLPRRERQRPLAVLHVGEALLLGRRDHFAVAHQAGGAIVEDGIDAERVPRLTPQARAAAWAGPRPDADRTARARRAARAPRSPLRKGARRAGRRYGLPGTRSCSRSGTGRRDRACGAAPSTARAADW